MKPLGDRDEDMVMAAWEIPAWDLSGVLAEIAVWERVMLLVRNGDAVAEVEVPAAEGAVSGDWLNWIGEGSNLHIRVSAARRILALVRPGKSGLTYSFNLVDQAGQVYCRFYTRTPAASKRFLAFCSAYEPLAALVFSDPRSSVFPMRAMPATGSPISSRAESPMTR
jgi:putative heme iron utilization protein